jgi:LysR family carnitine catabolism transcriptional activator
MRINLTPTQLAGFLALARSGSFSDAARQLGISQSALSRTIQAMERTLGRRLFDRTTRSVTPTPIGIELMPLAERMVAEFDSAYGELAQFIDGRSGRLVIAALPSISAVLLPATIARFAESYPEVDIVIRDGLSESVVDAVAGGRADIGLTVRPPPSAKLSYRHLVADEFGLVCRPDDTLAGEAAVGWSVFEPRRFVAMAPGSSVRAMTDAAFHQAGLAIKPLFECAFVATTGNLVAARLGITALPRLTMPLIGAAPLVWRKLARPVLSRRLGVVTRTGRALSPAADHFLATLHAVARRLALAPVVAGHPNRNRGRP